VGARTFLLTKLNEGTIMKTHLLGLLVPLLLASGAAQARDGFESVWCGSDITRALTGKRISNEPVLALERRHAGLGLKDLGGDEISDQLNSTSWLICEREYILLSDAQGVVHDVLPLPPHSRTSPEFAAGTCQANGRPLSGIAVAVLENRAASGHRGSSHYSPQDTTLLPAKAAWKIDQMDRRFVALSTNGLYCPRGGIITVDGGP
jgi:hypothetical protein